MNKYLKLVIVFSVMIVAGGLLAGCGIKSDSNEPEENNLPAEQTEPTVQEQQPAEPAPITDADIDQELKGLDASLDTVKVTGFEAKDLSDKDLGL